MAAFATLRESLSLLATRRFGTFWVSSLLSNIGTWAQQVAQPWLLLSLGASSFLIGLDSFAMNAPVWALTLVGGMLADRRDRRFVIALFQSIQMLCPTAIVVMLITHTATPWAIVALSLVVGVTDALSMPSFSSIVPSLVKREQIPQGLALNSTQFNLSRILGPSIAGVLMSSGGAMMAFAISAASYIPFIGVALWILPPRMPTPSAQVNPARNPLAGVTAALRDGQLRGALLTVLTTGILCAPLVTFIPVLVRDVFHGDANRFSIAVAAFGAGGILGAGGLLSIPSTVSRRTLSTVFAGCYGAVVVLTALDPWYWGVPALLVIAGAAMVMSNTSANALLQGAAQSSMLGQTVSLYMLAMRGGSSIGALLTGALVNGLGVQKALLINGALAVVLQVVIGRSWARAKPDPEPAPVVA